MTRRVVCIVNGAAGSGGAQERVRQLAASCRDHCADSEIMTVPHGGDIGALAAEAVRSRPDAIVACGGDGTVRSVAAALAGSDVALGIVPLGTLNHFAKDVGIPLDVPEAVATVFHGEAQRVDLGDVNGQVFLNNSSLGVYPWIVREREHEQKHGRSKWVALAHATLSVLRRHRTLRVRIEVDDAAGPVQETPFLFVGNNRYALGGARIGARESLRRGQLWACMAPPASRAGFVLLGLRMLLRGKPVEAVTTFDRAEFSVHSHASSLSVSADGEVMRLTPPLHYRSRPGALRVLVPASVAGPKRE